MLAIYHQPPLLALFAQTTSPPVESYSVSLKTVALILLGGVIVVLLLSRSRQHDIWSFRATVLSLLVLGVMLLFIQLPYVDQAFTHSLGDALIIASVLAFTVDFYLKERVLREVSSDVSKYLVGYRLPEEVQNRIECSFDLLGRGHLYADR